MRNLSVEDHSWLTLVVEHHNQKLMTHNDILHISFCKILPRKEIDFPMASMQSLWPPGIHIPETVWWSITNMINYACLPPRDKIKPLNLVIITVQKIAIEEQKKKCLFTKE